jgi:Icc-related predicted phosphoesterase
LKVMNAQASKILVVSDLHYEKGYHHGIYEFGAFDWLLKTIKKQNPSDLIGLGDWGTAWTHQEWDALTDVICVHAIYGNHENLETLRSAKNSDGTRVLVEDGEIRGLYGLRFGFINGIIASTDELRHQVPRKTSDQYRQVSERLRGIDVLCTHESPITPEYGTRIRRGPGAMLALEIIEKLQPSLALSGHLSGPYTISRVGKSLSVRIDSSQKDKHVAVLRPAESTVEVWDEHKLVVGESF